MLVASAVSFGSEPARAGHYQPRGFPAPAIGLADHSSNQVIPARYVASTPYANFAQAQYPHGNKLSAPGGLNGPSAGSSPSLPVRDLAPLSSTSWLVGDEKRSYRLPTWTETPWLQRFVNPAVERVHPQDEFLYGRYGQRSLRREFRLAWPTLGAEAALPTNEELELQLATPSHLWAPSHFWMDYQSAAELELVQPAGKMLTGQIPFLNSTAGRRAWHGRDVFPTWALNAAPEPFAPFASAPLRTPCAAWAPKPRAVHIGRYGAEYDSFILIECDGSVAPEALDRLSVMARPPGIERPELPLPLRPDAKAAAEGEWLEDIRLLHPRVVWLVNKFALAFPGRGIYLISGYRKDSHSSLHRHGRALDLFVNGVPNESVFKYCRKLKDVGCGYYPNNNFIHVDIRAYGTGHPFWIDASAPGAPSEYVDSWPGVIESGGLVWGGGE